MRTSQFSTINENVICHSFDKEVEIFHYSNVSNCKMLLDAIRNRSSPIFQFTAIDASKIASLFILKVAITKALINSRNKSLKTHSINSEILHMLGTDNSVSQSFKNFGISSGTKDIIIIILTEKDENTDSLDTKVKQLDLLISGIRNDTIQISPNFKALSTVF